jgi:hypothetical protein
MPNDAKLGLLVGMAGVLAAAVLFFQNGPAIPTPPAAQSAPPPAPKPSQIFGKKSEPANPAAEKASKEPEARPVSRTAEE